MPISEQARRQRQYADRLIWEQAVDRRERHWSSGLAVKLFPTKGPGLVPDHKRGAVSPLGGVAAPNKGGKR
jgi:hypothetical protein